MELRGSVAIVTGLTGWLGGCIASAFARAGADVVGVYLQSTDLARERAQALRSHGARAIAVQADVSAATGAQKMVDEAVAAFGRVDVLVNNAGFNQSAPFSDLDALSEDLRRRSSRPT